jgi:hypothetical protein
VENVDFSLLCDGDWVCHVNIAAKVNALEEPIKGKSSIEGEEGIPGDLPVGGEPEKVKILGSSSVSWKP